MLVSRDCQFVVPDFTDKVRTRISDNCNNNNEIDISQLPVAGTIVTANSQVQITITDSCGNSAMMNVNILVPEPLQVSIIPDVSQFCENDSVTMTATVTGGTAGFTYDWQPINGLNVTNQSIVVARPTAGVYTYQLTVLDANGCNAVATSVVTVDSLPMAPVVSSTPNTICVGTQNGTIIIENPLGTGYSYSLNGAAFQDTTTVYDNLSVGNYTIIAQTAEGCSSTQTMTSIQNSQDLPTVVIHPNDMILCPNLGTQTVTAEILNGEAPFTVAWNTNQMISSDSLTAILGFLPQFCDTNYIFSVNFTDANNCSATASDTIFVADNELPTITGTIAVTTINGCTDNDAPAAVTTPAGLIALGLQLNDNCTAVNNLTVHSQDQVAGHCPIVITRIYQVEDECGNVSADFVQTLQVFDSVAPLMNNITITLNLNGCDASVAPAVATTPSELTAIGFTFSDNCTANNDLTVEVVADTTGNCPMVLTRYYSVVDECGNESTAAIHEILIFDSVAPVINGFIADIFVDGCDTTVLRNHPIAATAAELLALDAISITELCTQTANLIVHSQEDTSGNCPIQVTRTYNVEDECGNISNDITQIIYIQDVTAPTFTGVVTEQLLTSTNCVFVAPDLSQLVSNVTVDNCTSTADLTFTQVPAIGDVITASMPVEITIEDACGNRSMMNINVLLQDSLSVVVTPTNTRFCEQDSVVFTAAANGGAGGYIYQWTPATGLNVVDNDIVVARPTTGIYTYQVEVTDANGCVAVDTAYVIVDSLPATPQVSIEPNTMCVGTPNGSITIVDPIGNGYAYSLNGQPYQDTTLVYNNLLEGNYTLIVQTNEGCLSNEIAIDVINTQNMPVVTINPVALILCPNALTQDLAADVVNGTAPYVFTWNGNHIIATDSSTATMEILAQFCDTTYEYSLTVTDANNCSATASDTIFVADNELPTITGTIAVTTINGCTDNDAPAAVTTPAGLIALGLQLNDNCTAVNNLTVHSQDQVAGHCPIVITRIYQVEDECGNVSADFVQTLQVFDSVAPLMNNVTITLNLNGCDASVR